MAQAQTGTTGLRILIADDDAATRVTIAEQLRLIGHEVVGTAANGNEAIDLTLALKPDVAILDIKMPERDGLEAAREIMERQPTAILMLTGFHDDEFIQQASDIGVFAYLVKPAGAKTLKASLDVAMKRFDELQAARKEAADLKDALETRKMVERAKGILMQRLNLSEADAFRRLQRESNNQSRPLKQVAEAILIAEGILKDSGGKTRPPASGSKPKA